jgi:phospholipase C
MSFLTIDKFVADAAAGTLPQISYIIGPAELSEHPPYQPKDGAWLQQKIVNAVVNSKSYNKTALFISYDETGGWGDHVTPFHSPPGTTGEWVKDPYGKFGQVYTGPGFRLPFYIISPWTRGGNVFTERSDHVSQIKFVGEYCQFIFIIRSEP